MLKSTRPLAIQSISILALILYLILLSDRSLHFIIRANFLVARGVSHINLPSGRGGRPQYGLALWFLSTWGRTPQGCSGEALQLARTFDLTAQVRTPRVAQGGLANGLGPTF